jgi:GTP-binding protein
MPVVALVGRPNVGKSTLFNRLAGERISIVEDEPGTTRDRLYATTEWTGHAFILIDTGGVDVALTDKAVRKDGPEALGQSSRSFAREIRQQAEVAISEADVVVLVMDARDGLTEADRDVADILRRSARPIILAVNKAENVERRQGALEFYELGLGEPYAISAHHGAGTGDLLDAIVAHLPQVAEEEVDPDRVRIAIVGRPNVGKSSLLNALIQEERAIVSAIPGTTRDAIDTEMTWQGQKITLVDTAGIRRRGRVEVGVEKYSVMRALNAVQRSDVVLLVLDATTGVTSQDTHVAGFVLEAYKSVAVIVNKWDAVEDKDNESVARFTAEVRNKLRFLDYVPVLFVSALTRQRVSKIMPLAVSIAGERTRRIPTAELNRLLREALTARPAMSRRGKQLKLLYATQAEVAPPTFVLFVNDPELVHFTYERYLENRIREVYPFVGTPIRLRFRARDEKDGK